MTGDMRGMSTCQLGSDVLRSNGRFPWIELAAFYGDRMRRGHFVRINDTKAISVWRGRFDDRDVFRSVAVFAAPDVASPFLVDLFFRVICHDLEDARKDAVRSIEHLNERIGVPEECVEIMFSGSRSFHMAVPLTVFGAGEQTGLMPLWHRLADRLWHLGMCSLDVSAYRPSHLTRLPNSVNSRTGLYAIPLEYKELRDFSAEDILDLARGPRTESNLAIAEESDRAAAWLRKSMKKANMRGLRSKHSSGFRQALLFPSGSGRVAGVFIHRSVARSE